MSTMRNSMFPGCGSTSGPTSVLSIFSSLRSRQSASISVNQNKISRNECFLRSRRRRNKNAEFHNFQPGAHFGRALRSRPLRRNSAGTQIII